MTHATETWEVWAAAPADTDLERLAKRFCRELLGGTTFLGVWRRGVAREDELAVLFQQAEQEIRYRLRAAAEMPRYGRTRLLRIEPAAGEVRLHLRLEDDRGGSVELVLPLVLQFQSTPAVEAGDLTY